jgi:tripartite-type tricarboxylate transporter receptor subunit TctC
LEIADVRAKLTPRGFYPAPTWGAAFTSYLRQQYEDYARIIRDANITGE